MDIFVISIHSRTTVTTLDTYNDQNQCFSTDTGTKTKNQISIQHYLTQKKG